MARRHWLGLGVMMAGLSAYVLTGAAAAQADSDASSSTGGQSTSGAPSGGQQSADSSGTSAGGTAAGTGSADSSSADTDADADAGADADTDTDTDADADTDTDTDTDADTDAVTDADVEQDELVAGDSADPQSPADTENQDDGTATDAGDDTAAPPEDATVRDGQASEVVETATAAPEDGAGATAVESEEEPSSPAVQPVAEAATVDEAVAEAAVADEKVAVLDISDQSTGTVSADTATSAATEAAGTDDAEPASAEASATLLAASAQTTTQATTTRMSILDMLFSAFWGMMASIVQSAAGAPSLPAGSTVTLRSSSLQLTDTLSVPADWYFPAATESGEAPEHIIFLAHGFFTVGSMYSYTAAQLAEETGSIVVVPTMSWNPYAADGLWVSGPAMQPVIAGLFDGDRAALNASALAAGYAELYGLDPAVAELPREFVLSGHSAGAALVLGAVVYLDDETLDDLTGMLLFDAVTSGTTAADGLGRLGDYEDATGRYIPVHEISAPTNDWNKSSNIAEALTAARPDHFNGVVIARGAHTDVLQSGSSAVRGVITWLVGTIPQSSVLALQQIAVDSLNSWYAGQSEAAYTASSDTTIVISTPAGPATATVIGVLPAAIVPGRVDGDTITV